MIKILVIDYQSEFVSNLLSMLVDIEASHAQGEVVGSIRPSNRRVDSYWVAKEIGRAHV